MDLIVGAHSQTGEGLAARVQGHHGDVIAGASYLRTRPYPADRWVSGRGEFVGVDARWMRAGWMLRGEWIHGHPFDGIISDSHPCKELSANHGADNAGDHHQYGSQ